MGMNRGAGFVFIFLPILIICLFYDLLKTILVFEDLENGKRRLASMMGRKRDILFKIFRFAFLVLIFIIMVQFYRTVPMDNDVVRLQSAEDYIRNGIAVDFSAVAIVVICAIFPILLGIDSLKRALHVKESKEGKRRVAIKPGEKFEAFYGILKLTGVLILLALIIYLALRGLLVIKL